MLKSEYGYILNAGLYDALIETLSKYEILRSDVHRTYISTHQFHARLRYY